MCQWWGKPSARDHRQTKRESSCSTFFSCAWNRTVRRGTLCNFPLFFVQRHRYLPVLECQGAQVIPKTQNRLLVYAVFPPGEQLAVALLTCSDTQPVLWGSIPSWRTTTHPSILRRLFVRSRYCNGICSMSHELEISHESGGTCWIPRR